MKIKEIKAKSIITKSNLPDADFVINPYIGCMHGCKYCYAVFMKRFTGHKEEWGKFVDVKINAPDLIKVSKKYENKNILIGSVTDPYLPLERKYKLTRKILEKLILLKPRLDIITKSDLILRDVDLLKQFKDCTVAVSLSTLNDNIRKKLEPLACSVERRLNVLKKLHKTKIKTILFISPIFPEITDWKKMINKTKKYVDEYWFENLNLYPSIRSNIYKFLNKKELIERYKEIYSTKKYWKDVEKEIEKFCKRKVDYIIYFHH